MRTYNVECRLDADGYWVGIVREVPACLSQGRSLKQLRDRIREALSLWVKDAAKAEIVMHAAMLKQTREAVEAYRAIRSKLEAEKNIEQRHQLAAVRALTQKMGISVRDAAEVLGLSFQRVQQLTKQIS